MSRGSSHHHLAWRDVARRKIISSSASCVARCRAAEDHLIVTLRGVMSRGTCLATRRIVIPGSMSERRGPLQSRCLEKPVCLPLEESERHRRLLDSGEFVDDLVRDLVCDLARPSKGSAGLVSRALRSTPGDRSTRASRSSPTSSFASSPPTSAATARGGASRRASSSASGVRRRRRPPAPTRRAARRMSEERR